LICLIGTVRREYLDRVFFWNAADLRRKLEAFRDYYNASRVHRPLDGSTVAAYFRPQSPLEYEFATDYDIAHIAAYCEKAGGNIAECGQTIGN
jgi:hypothetical protein